MTTDFTHEQLEIRERTIDDLAAVVHFGKRLFNSEFSVSAHREKETFFRQAILRVWQKRRGSK